MTRPAPARRRLVPPTLRDEPRDSVCAEIAVRRTRDRSDISHSSSDCRQRRPDAPNLPGRRQFKVADDLWLFRSVAVAKAARATRRSSSPPELGPNRRTCHHTQRKTVATLDSPLQVACALALNTKAEDAKRQRWHQGARSGAYQAGWRGELAGGGAPEVRAGPRLSLCSVPAAYSRRRGRGWGRWGPLRLCVVGAACSLVITAGCISGGCGAWWLAAALLMTRRSAPSVRPFRAGRPPAAVAAADGPAGVLAPSLRGCVLLARPAACGVTAAPRAVGCVTRALAECSATSSSRGGRVAAGRGAARETGCWGT